MSDLPAKSEFLIYEAESGRIKLEGRFEGETVWLSQQIMTELFQTTQHNLSLHLRNIYEEGEQQLEATHKEFLSVRSPLLRELPWSSHLRIFTIEKEAKGFPDRRLKADAGR